MSHDITQGEEGTQEELTHPDKRCAHVKEDGTRCKGWRVKDSELCAGHLNGFGRGGADPREAASKSAEVRREAAEERSEARKRGLKDVLAAKLEEHAETLVTRLLDIAENGSDADALRAIEAMSNRVLGRPTERVEVDDVRLPQSVEELDRMTPEERRAALVELNKRRRTGTEG